MVNVLEGGSKSLKEMVKEAEKLGYVVNQQNAALVGKSGDALDRIKVSLDGMARIFAVQLAPYIILAGNKMAEFAASLNAAMSASGGMAKFFAIMLDEIEFFKLAWEAMVATSPLNMAADAIDGDMKDTRDRFAKLKEDFLKKPLSERIGKMIEAIKAEVAGSAGKSTIGPADPLGLMNKQVAAPDTSALLRGSQAAFSAIMASSKQDVEKAQLAELKKMTDYLRAAARRGGLFGPALLGGGA